METVRECLAQGDPDRHCTDCRGVLKPSVVMFGELLPPEPMRRAARWAHNADALLAVGSTLSIYPAASVVAKTARPGTPLVIVNQGPTDHDDLGVTTGDVVPGGVV
jgi:NAD-dependent deacetylase